MLGYFWVDRPDTVPAGFLFMSLPIKPTPILRGKSARIFEKQIKENEKTTIPEGEYMKAKKLYESVMRNPKNKILFFC